MPTAKYTLTQIKELKSQTDWERLENMKDSDIDYSDIPDLSELLAAGKIRRVGRPKKENTKKMVNIRFDQDVLDGLKSTGRNWTTRVNDVMREYLSRIGVL